MRNSPRMPLKFNAKFLICVMLSVVMLVSASGLSILSIAAPSDSSSYFDIYDELSKSALSQGKMELSAADLGAAVCEEYGVAVVELGKNSPSVSWSFNVSEDAVSALRLFYAPITDGENDIIFKIEIDGVSPFTEAAAIVLPRIWETEYQKGYPFLKDVKGDDIRPDRYQVSRITSVAISDTRGFYDEPYLFSLTSGEHTLTLTALEGSAAVEKLVFENESAISYKEYKKAHSKDQKGKGTAYLQAEITSSTNDISLYPSYDRLDAGTMPSDPKHLLLNTVGGANWKNSGDEISWEVNVEKAGLYRIALRARQNVNSGLMSYRSLYINGKLPFAEAESLAFKYSQGWKVDILGDNSEEYLFYLEPGDIITLSCTTGDTAKSLRTIQTVTERLTTLYREVISITSTSPDPYQDYGLEDKIPDIEERIKSAENSLNTTYDELCKILGSRGSLASSIKSSSETLEKFRKKPYEIPVNLSSFKSVLESLGTLTLSLSEQPLEIDYFTFLGADAEKPKANVGFWKSFSYGTVQFLNSFAPDYSNNDNGKGKTINVWVSTGRDQAKIISSLVTSDFTEKTGVNINLSLVDTGTTLMRASLADRGPDVALLIGQDIPVQLAARDAVVELSDYITDDLKNAFHPSAWTPFTYNGGIYGLPEQQMFDMLFYRTDVFEQLGITAPETWDEFYEVMQVVQSNNLAVGLQEIDGVNMGVSAGLNVFNALLLQRGGTYYSDDLSKTLFDTEVAYEAFTEWSDFYTKYSLERSFSFYNRFRTGEMPIAIQNISIYPQLREAAPEIRGLWKMALIPGTRQKNGEIDHSETSSLSACIMMKAAERRNVADEAAEFMKWWVSADVQDEYGKSLEIALGVAGRYYTANLEAMEKGNWSSEEMALIKEQLSYIENVPTVTAIYEVKRGLTSALRDVISGNNRPRRALMLYNSDINDEIARKSAEFGKEEK